MTDPALATYVRRLAEENLPALVEFVESLMQQRERAELLAASRARVIENLERAMKALTERPLKVSAVIKPAAPAASPEELGI